MTAVEVVEMLKATMHGELPRDTQQRILATLAEWAPVMLRVERERAAKIEELDRAEHAHRYR
jgi:putative heme iron utilization protein